jgi:DNA polymerase V
MHRPQDIEKVLRKYPIEDVWGIGRKLSAKLHSIGIRTAFDYTLLPDATVRRMFGINGLRTWRELKGESCIEFEDGFEAKQSICVSRSFSKEIFDAGSLCEQVANFASSMAEKLRKQGSVACEMTVFAYTNRFKEDVPQAYITQLVSFSNPTNDHLTIVASAVGAMKEIFKRGYGYKKAGVAATRIVQCRDVVPSLFEDSQAHEKEHRITVALDQINASFGQGTVRFAVQGSGRVMSSSEMRSPRYTTLWEELPSVFVK